MESIRQAHLTLLSDIPNLTEFMDRTNDFPVRQVVDSSFRAGIVDTISLCIKSHKLFNTRSTTQRTRIGGATVPTRSTFGSNITPLTLVQHTLANTSSGHGSLNSLNTQINSSWTLANATMLYTGLGCGLDLLSSISCWSEARNWMVNDLVIDRLFNMPPQHIQASASRLLIAIAEECL